MNNYFDPNVYKGQPIYTSDNIPSIMNNNDKYIGINKGKKISIYASFLNTNEIKEFSGILESSDTNNFILSNPSDGKWYLIPKKYIAYIIFDEEIKYLNF